ncbi:MAG: hypothetical protein KKF24_16035 [Gammaproteobacteria bacterium]|nr:hypothetical protein [Gammaproteobacteria bacterium]MBU1834196.1 hypothetical protein [Gammaproteobacteria bacterium]
MDQITLNFDKGLTDSFGSCREYVSSQVHKQGRPQKSIAADMDYSPSTLARKCTQSPDDSQRFTLDDLEKFMSVTGDTSPVLYLVEKYLTEHDRIAELEKELARLRAAA